MGQADRNGISGISPGSPAPLNSCRLGSLLQSLRPRLPAEPDAIRESHSHGIRHRWPARR
jgi:hypothetical protein